MLVGIDVWVCPTEGCGNFYGSSTAGDLAAKVNNRTAMQNKADEDPSSWGRVISTRDECSDCRAAGRGVVRRELHSLAVETGTGATAAA